MGVAPARARPSILPVSRIPLPIALGLVIVGTPVLYLGFTAMLGIPLGFPLDDSWIHQTFARNLARTGRFAYQSGELSAGSTAPLWTILLAVGYLLPIDFRVWSYGLGLLCLALAALLVARLANQLMPARPVLSSIAALATTLEWHLAWSALAGMETALFIALSLLLVDLTLRRARAVALGVVGGLLTLTRPEGLVLTGLALLWRCTDRVSRPAWQGRGAMVLDIATIVGVFGFVTAPGVVLNIAAAGTPLPTTYYAKSAAYAVDPSPASIFRFLGRAALELATGPLLLLAPAIGYLIVREGRAALVAIRDRRLGRIAAPSALPITWISALLLLYAIELPAVFHHGRYLMPTIPWLILLGLRGLDDLLASLPLRLVARTTPALLALFWLAMWANGAVVYGWDCRFINDEQIAVAHWLRANTPADAVIATHDIGAIGYFANRRLVDTAGLITPELARHARDQASISAYLAQHQVEYLAIFPSWYPRIADDPAWRVIFRVEQTYPRAQGAENMIVLRRQ